MKRLIAGSLLIVAALFAGAGCPENASTDGVDQPVAEAPTMSPTSESAESAQLLPQSDDRALERSDLEKLNNWELTLARNEIFARHGRPFQNARIRRHFEGMPWYSPDPDYVDAWLSQLERENADRILEYQKLTYEIPARQP